MRRCASLTEGRLTWVWFLRVPRESTIIRATQHNTFSFQRAAMRYPLAGVRDCLCTLRNTQSS